MKEIARLFKSLSDETRLRILNLLTYGELCVCDLMEVLSLPQSTISRHIAYLKNAGLVKSRREGVWIYYSLAKPKDNTHRFQIRYLRKTLRGYKALKADGRKLKNLEKSKCD
jgi:ArsR family transcriptional regulator